MFQFPCSLKPLGGALFCLLAETFFFWQEHLLESRRSHTLLDFSSSFREPENCFKTTQISLFEPVRVRLELPRTGIEITEWQWTYFSLCCVLCLPIFTFRPFSAYNFYVLMTKKRKSLYNAWGGKFISEKILQNVICSYLLPWNVFMVDLMNIDLTFYWAHPQETSHIV